MDKVTTVRDGVIKGREKKAEYKERIGYIRVRTMTDEVKEQFATAQAPKAWGTRR